jgi:hypothetical protein
MFASARPKGGGEPIARMRIVRETSREGTARQPVVRLGGGDVLMDSLVVLKWAGKNHAKPTDDRDVKDLGMKHGAVKGFLERKQRVWAPLR